jgi:serine/threonine-protein kinase RsbW
MELVAGEASRAAATAFGMDGNRAEEVRLAVVEACLNAIEHSQPEDGRIEIDLSLGEDEAATWLEVVVRDRGRGFSPDSVPVPDLAENLRRGRRRGWGLQIIRSLMDRVEIESGPKGTELKMYKLCVSEGERKR